MSGARIDPGSDVANVATGVPLLDHLVLELARAARFGVLLEIEPDDAEAEVDAAGAAFGAAVAELVPVGAHGSASVPCDEALATVVLERSGRPLVVANVDLTGIGGLASDLAARFVTALSRAAGLTIHVRLVEGEDSEHVVTAIFKALGVALADATEAPA